MTNPQNTKVKPAQIVNLLVLPSHDKLTDYTSRLLGSFPPLRTPTISCKISHPITYDEMLSHYSIDPRVTDVALIFCGHGTESSLQGPGTHSDELDSTSSRSSFFDQRHLPIAPKFMLAFCSKSAVELGRAYRDRPGRTFVGFDDDIGFIMAGGEYADCWRNIVHGSASAMLTSTDLKSLEKSIRGLYRDAISFFTPDNDKTSEWGLMMRAYLRKQLEAIAFIRT